MIYKPDATLMRDRAKEIINARNWAIGVITTMLGIGMFISEVDRIRHLQPDVMNYAYLCLFAVTGVLVFFWIWATQKELDMLFEWLDPKHYEPPSTVKETLLILVFGFFLVALLFTSRNPLWYGIALSAYSLVLLPVGGIYMTRLIGEAIDRSRDRIRDENNVTLSDRRVVLYSEGIDIIDWYYRRNPVKTRLIIILAASVIGLIFSIVWKATGERILGLTAYGLYIATVVISEAVITRWRIVRDSGLRPLAAEIRELERELKKD